MGGPICTDPSAHTICETPAATSSSVTVGTPAAAPAASSCDAQSEVCSRPAAACELLLGAELKPEHVPLLKTFQPAWVSQEAEAEEAWSCLLASYAGGNPGSMHAAHALCPCTHAPCGDAHASHPAVHMQHSAHTATHVWKAGTPARTRAHMQPCSMRAFGTCLILWALDLDSCRNTGGMHVVACICVAL